MLLRLNLGLFLVLVLAPSALQAGVGKEAIEQLWKRFGKGALGESAEQFGRNLDDLVAKHGDDCLSLLGKGGHDAFRALNEVGEEGAGKLVRLFRNKGDDAWPIIKLHLQAQSLSRSRRRGRRGPHQAPRHRRRSPERSRSANCLHNRKA